jgi:hypothetical protein
MHPVVQVWPAVALSGDADPEKLAKGKECADTVRARLCHNIPVVDV